jgi:hypothetical protein
VFAKQNTACALSHSPRAAGVFEDQRAVGMKQTHEFKL